MKVFILQGVSCFSGATFDCTSTFENWQQVLKEEGQRVCPGRNPDTMIFHRVNIAIEEARALSLLSSTLYLRTQQNRSRREQLSSRSSLLDMSFLEPVIGPRLHGCGTYWTYVEARVAGLSITTIKSSDTRGCQFVMETSLPVMSEVSALPSCESINGWEPFLWCDVAFVLLAL